MKTVAAAVGQIVQFVDAGIQRTGGDFMQQGFPQESGVGVSQFDLRLTAAAQFTAQPGSGFGPASATPQNDEAMHSCTPGKSIARLLRDQSRCCYGLAIHRDLVVCNGAASGLARQWPISRWLTSSGLSCASQWVASG